MRLAITTSLPPNLLAHIYSSSGVYGNHQYQERFQHTLRSADIEFLRSLQHYFKGKPPMGGPLFSFLYQIPCYFATENLESILDTFDLLIEGLKSSNYPFKELEDTTLEALKVWMPTELIEASRRSIQPMLGMLPGLFERLKDIIANTHHTFYRDHWQERKLVLLKKAEDIYDEVEELPVFDAWSEVFNLSFPYREFVVYLVDALKGGTSLLAEKYALPSEVTLERAVNTIIHEVGIHLS